MEAVLKAAWWEPYSHSQEESKKDEAPLKALSLHLANRDQEVEQPAPEFGRVSRKFVHPPKVPLFQSYPGPRVFVFTAPHIVPE